MIEIDKTDNTVRLSDMTIGEAYTMCSNRKHCTGCLAYVKTLAYGKTSDKVSSRRTCALGYPYNWSSKTALFRERKVK